MDDSVGRRQVDADSARLGAYLLTCLLNDLLMTYSVGRRQVDADSARLGAEEEDEAVALWTREAVNGRLPLIALDAPE